jgi:hypothetical protein
MALSISKAWDETKAVLTRDGRLIGAVALALFVLPGLILDLTVPDTAPGTLPAPGPWIGVALIVFFVSLSGQLAVIRLAMGPQLTVAEAILHGARRCPAYFGALAIWLLPIIVVGFVLASQILSNPDNPRPAVALGLLVLTVVLAFFSVRFALNPPVASAEGGGPIAILRRGWALTVGHWWVLFGFVFVFGLGVLALLFAVGVVTGIIAKLLLGGLGQGTIGGLVVALVSQALSAAAYSTFFVMLARIYAQLSGTAARTGVPNSGT